jgi:hypothetical protein
MSLISWKFKKIKTFIKNSDSIKNTMVYALLLIISLSITLMEYLKHPDESFLLVIGFTIMDMIIFGAILFIVAVIILSFFED